MNSPYEEREKMLRLIRQGVSDEDIKMIMGYSIQTIKHNRRSVEIYDNREFIEYKRKKKMSEQWSSDEMDYGTVNSVHTKYTYCELSQLEKAMYRNLKSKL